MRLKTTIKLTLNVRRILVRWNGRGSNSYLYRCWLFFEKESGQFSPRAYPLIPLERGT